RSRAPRPAHDPRSGHAAAAPLTAVTAPGCLEWARPAVRADAARLGELWDAADAEMRDQRGGARLLDSTGRPAELTAAAGAGGGGDPLVTGPDRLVVVGGIDQAPLGFATAGIHRLTPAPVAVIDVAYVEPGARGVGIGEAMLGRILAWAGSHGCAGVDAYALPGNRAAKAFFEDLGFTARLLTMYRRLEPGETPDA
ncbi:MAG: GNAT family N-acetyltransferase, partial [Acidimicrobiales bacterium]